MNDSEKSVREIAQFLGHLQPNIAYLSVLTKPPAEKHICPADPESVNVAFQLLSNQLDRFEFLTGYEGNTFSSTGDAREDILNIATVHPLRKDAVAEILNHSKAEWASVKGMLQEGELIQSEFEDHIFFKGLLIYSSDF
jgi:wyosine [tRNA(Phe)-imidazoG37] synthetase (radical SAM superfamily)